MDDFEKHGFLTLKKNKERHELSLKKAQSVKYAHKKTLDPFPINDDFNMVDGIIIE